MALMDQAVRDSSDRGNYLRSTREHHRELPTVTSGYFLIFLTAPMKTRLSIDGVLIVIWLSYANERNCTQAKPGQGRKHCEHWIKRDFPRDY
jgi:hypothetical protein